jgi:hypothetical protein
MIGAVRPGLDHDKQHWRTNDGYLISEYDGGLWGNGKWGADPQGKFAEGDRVGVLLDLDAGWLRFYRNDKRCGPGYTEGVTGPLVRAAHVVHNYDDARARCACRKVTVLPGAVAPEGAGAAAEPWDGPPAPEPESEPESESEADY